MNAAMREELIQAVRAARQGDVSVRLSEERFGELGHELNELLATNEAFGNEITRVGRLVGEEGMLDERTSPTPFEGFWSETLCAVNTLIDDLVRPLSAVESVLRNVADGDLTRELPITDLGRPLKGRLYEVATTANSLITHLDAFTTEITRVTREVGTDGKLGGQIEVEGIHGSWKVIRDNINRMALNLTYQVRNISDVATAVRRSASELSAVSGRMHSSASETSTQAQAASSNVAVVDHSVQAVTSDIEALSAGVHEIARCACEAAEVGAEATEAADATRSALSELGSSSSELGKVIEVLGALGDQLHLLGLNAAIEAARAGEGGRGFAVVANEVKELARETATTSEAIRQRIEGIQADTHGASDAIGRIGSLLGRIHGAQRRIVRAVEQQTATAVAMERNLEHAVHGASEVSADIAKVASAAGWTSTGAHDSQDAVAEIERVAEELQTLLGRFTY